MSKVWLITECSTGFGSVRAAKAILKAVEAGKPPWRLLPGSAVLKGARIKREELKHDFDSGGHNNKRRFPGTRISGTV
jgi:hypothetical protein